MKKVAILTCLKSNEVCTGASCLTALNERKKSFSCYQKEEISLVAFMKCNGCDCDYERDAGYLEKIERLVEEKVEVVHVGVCTKDWQTKTECVHVTKIIQDLMGRGISVVRGTH